jgi:hypothetical protein
LVLQTTSNAFLSAVSSAASTLSFVPSNIYARPSSFTALNMTNRQLFFRLSTTDDGATYSAIRELPQGAMNPRNNSDPFPPRFATASSTYCLGVYSDPSRFIGDPATCSDTSLVFQALFTETIKGQYANSPGSPLACPSGRIAPYPGYRSVTCGGSCDAGKYGGSTTDYTSRSCAGTCPSGTYCPRATGLPASIFLGSRILRFFPLLV